MSETTNIYEELEENFTILENQTGKIKEIFDDKEYSSYDKAVRSIIKKLKDLGYTTLKFPYHKHMCANLRVNPDNGKRRGVVRLVDSEHFCKATTRVYPNLIDKRVFGKKVVE